MPVRDMSPCVIKVYVTSCGSVCRQSNEDDKKLSSRLKVVQASLGAGVHKKLILGGAAFKDDDKKRMLAPLFGVSRNTTGRPVTAQAETGPALGGARAFR